MGVARQDGRQADPRAVHVVDIRLPACPPRSHRVVELVRQHGWADADRWLEAWEEAWAANLEACRPGPRGACSIQLT